MEYILDNSHPNATATSTAGPTGFLALPGEIRNTIYRFAIVEDEPLLITYKTVPVEPSLLQTCRSIRREAWPIFYYENTYEIETTNRDMEPFITFYKQRGLNGKDFPLRFSKRTSHLQSTGSSPFTNFLRYIKAWYTEEIVFTSTRCDSKVECQKCRGVIRDQLSYNGVAYKLWDIAKSLKKANVAWEVAAHVLESAGDLLHALPGFKTEPLECYFKPSCKAR